MPPIANALGKVILEIRRLHDDVSVEHLEGANPSARPEDFNFIDDPALGTRPFITFQFELYIKTRERETDEESEAEDTEQEAEHMEQEAEDTEEEMIGTVFAITLESTAFVLCLEQM